MKPLEKKLILGADGKTMVHVYDGDVDYQLKQLLIISIISIITESVGKLDRIISGLL